LNSAPVFGDQLNPSKSKYGLAYSNMQSKSRPSSRRGEDSESENINQFPDSSDELKIKIDYSSNY